MDEDPQKLIEGIKNIVDIKAVTLVEIVDFVAT